MKNKNSKIYIYIYEERLRNLWDNFKHSHIGIIGVPGEEERARNWKLIWTNNEGKPPQSGKGNKTSRKSRKLRESQRSWTPRRNTPRHIIITLPKIKEKERILQAAREKDTVTYKGVPIRLSTDFSRDLTGTKGLERSIRSHERQGPTYIQDYSVQQSYHLEWKGR